MERSRSLISPPRAARSSDAISLLFAVNLRTFGVVRHLGWFTDADGQLKQIGP